MDTENKNVLTAEPEVQVNSNQNDDAISQDALQIYYEELYAIEREKYNAMFGAIVPRPDITKKYGDASREVAIPDEYGEATLRTLSTVSCSPNSAFLDSKKAVPVEASNVSTAPLACAVPTTNSTTADDTADKKIKKLKKQKGLIVAILCVFAIAVAGHFVYQFLF